MSRLTPSNPEEFRTACARLRNMPEFQIILAYLGERVEKHREALVTINATDFPKLQGRASEVTDIITELKKPKD